MPNGMKLTQREMIVQIYTLMTNTNEKIEANKIGLKEHIEAHWKFAMAVIGGSAVVIALLSLIIK